jgi:hypothetical protein
MCVRQAVFKPPFSCGAYITDWPGASSPRYRRPAQSVVFDPLCLFVSCVSSVTSSCPCLCLGGDLFRPGLLPGLSFGLARFGRDVTDGMLMRDPFAAAVRRQHFILKKFVKLSLSVYSAPNLHCKRY